jgi:dipeptidyl aminopeptidase/acylaminoacyl peptidase
MRTVPLLISFAIGFGQQSRLTIDFIMRGHGLTGYPPRDVRWSGDSRKIYFAWKERSEPVLKELGTYVVNRDGSGLRKLTDEEARLAPPAIDSRPESKIAYVVDYDLFVYDFATDQGRRLTRTRDIESSARMLRDGRRVAYARGGNLFVMALDTGVLTQLTDIRPFGSPVPDEEKKGTESQEFVKKEERELLDSVRQKAGQREEKEARKNKEYPLKPHILEARQEVRELALTPDEKYVIARITEKADKVRQTIVPAYVNESAYAETIESRTKVGDVHAKSRLAVIDMQNGEWKWVDHGLKRASGDPKKADVEREVALLFPIWSEDGGNAVLRALAADRKDRWLLALDPQTAKTRVVMNIHDDSWVDGPGDETLGWMKNGEDVFFQWERDGYSHLYTVPYAGGEPRQLTSGKWEVLAAKLSLDGSRFFLETNELHPAERQLYVMDARGGARTRITSVSGQHETVVSRDGQFSADLYSYVTKPTELFAQEVRAGAPALKLTSSPAPEFTTHPWLDAPIVSVPARDGVRVPGRLYKNPTAKTGGPAVLFVHGAGYLQNVHRGWSYYFREYLFHHFLLENGYTVLDIDYRGSAGYGRDWRTAIYRHMGGKDLDDQIDAARWLVSTQGVDPKRIGIYGGSYGGFLTLMAMFTQPDVFAAGAALRPVTDWAHYNQGYTSDILNEPQADAEAYRRSSPIYFAQGLKGALLICHGMVDVNVHFQDSVRLAQKLIELGKQNWELAVYPVEDHAFVQPSSWTDEFKRIFALFERNLKR